MARIKPQDLLQQSKKKKAPSRMSVTAIVSYCLILLLTLFFLYSTYKHWSLSLKHEAFMFGASKTKHDDRGEDVVQEIEENIPRSHAGIIDVTWRQKI
ncbi:hypothetical protein Peur_011499 [Populus x canadensis]